MTEARHTINTWALIATTITSAAVIYFCWWIIDLLSAPNWCDRALGAAEKADARNEFGVGGCFNLLNLQVEALALNSHLLVGTLALCLAVLVVIVIAGGRLSFKASKTGIETDIGKDNYKAVEAARRVEYAATEERQVIEQEATPKVPPKPEYRTYPEPEIE